MGATFCYKQMSGSLTREDAISEIEALIQNSMYENGCYSGDWGMATGVKITNIPEKEDPEEWLMEHCQKWEEVLIGKHGNKWHAGCMASS